MSIVNLTSKQKRHKPVVHSISTQAQNETEYECRPFFVDLSAMAPTQLEHLRETGLLHAHQDETLDICLVTQKHISYLEQTWKSPDVPLRMSFLSLDASRPWMLYWTLHACDLMGHSPDEQARINIISTLQTCWTRASIELTSEQVQCDVILQNHVTLATTTRNSDSGGLSWYTFPGGGFGGGPGQLPHAATTYAAVLALCIIAHPSAAVPVRHVDQSASTPQSPSALQALKLLESIRLPLYVWIKSLQQPDGAYVMHLDGERDVRATYCLVAVAKLLGILTPELCTPDVVQYCAQCQTWEGGFGGEPGSEAHGGYAFCATAALQLMQGSLEDVNVDALTSWLARRQMSYEGGFNGRSNKLVDGCYSFWQGGAMAIVSMYHSLKACKLDSSNNNDTDEDPWFAGRQSPLLFDEGMLERYILLCGQDVNGGLRDKPSKRRDFYHSCYCLSGLSVAQSSPQEMQSLSFGHSRAARVHKTHPCYNIRIERAQAIVRHFKSMPI